MYLRQGTSGKWVCLKPGVWHRLDQENHSHWAVCEKSIRMGGWWVMAWARDYKTYCQHFYILKEAREWAEKINSLIPEE